MKKDIDNDRYYDHDRNCCSLCSLFSVLNLQLNNFVMNRNLYLHFTLHNVYYTFYIIHTLYVEYYTLYSILYIYEDINFALLSTSRRIMGCDNFTTKDNARQKNDHRS